MILHYPFVTEKAMGALENESKLQFLVDMRATRPQIKHEIEQAFGHTVSSVRTLITTTGKKKAIISFEKPTMKT